MTPVPPTLKPAPVIRRAADLRRLVDRLRHESLLAVDTESNSLYAYTERVCLVQLSTRTEDLIVDPLAVDDMSPLGDLFADPAIEIVFHAAEYDIMTLKRDFGYAFATLFDTMLAARICGWEAVGLGNVLAELFGVHADKKFQRANWSARPLSSAQLLYAQMDTHYLPEARDRMLAELTAAGRLDEARELFADLCDLPAAEYTFDPDGFWRVSGARDLSRNQMAIVRELYLMRDEFARRRDCPPFKVFGDKTLVMLAQTAPRRPEDLRGLPGMTPDQIRRYGEAIVRAVAQSRRAAPPQPPRSRDAFDPDVQLRYEALREWRKQRAAARGVESDVIVPRTALWALARQVPDSVEGLEGIPGLGPWRRAAYGPELIAVLQQVNGNR
ncbi:MAG: ribonuclease D [Anaerolineae bacterium]|nr:ribonuclease D [Anaerolineae bacterium]